MNPIIPQFLYVASLILVFFGFKKLCKPESARLGNILAAAGVILAVLAVFFAGGVSAANFSAPAAASGAEKTPSCSFGGYFLVVLVAAAGSALGALPAFKSKAERRPGLFVLLTGFGGLAAMLAAIGGYPVFMGYTLQDYFWFRAGARYLAVVVGAVVFMGSFVIRRKLAGGPQKDYFPGHKAILITMLVFIVLGFLAHLFGGSLGEVLTIVRREQRQLAKYIESISLAVAMVFSLPLGWALVRPLRAEGVHMAALLLNALAGLAVAFVGVTVSSGLIVAVGGFAGGSALALVLSSVKESGRSLLAVLFKAPEP